MLAPVSGALLSSVVDKDRPIYSAVEAVTEFPVADNKLLGITVNLVEEVPGLKTVEEPVYTVFDTLRTVLSVDFVGITVELIVGLLVNELDALTTVLSVACVEISVELTLRLLDDDREKISFIQSARTDVEFLYLLSHPGNDSL